MLLYIYIMSIITTNQNNTTTEANYLELLKIENYAMLLGGQMPGIDNLNYYYAKEYEEAKEVLLTMQALNLHLDAYCCKHDVYWRSFAMPKKLEAIRNAALSNVLQALQDVFIPEHYVVAAYLDNYIELHKMMALAVYRLDDIVSILKWIDR